MPHYVAEDIQYIYYENIESPIFKYVKTAAFSVEASAKGPKGVTY